MKKSWTQGLEPDVATEMRMAFKSSLVLRKRMAEMLRTKEQDNYKTNISNSNYDSPNWAFQKADSIGYARALIDILNLMEEN